MFTPFPGWTCMYVLLYNWIKTVKYIAEESFKSTDDSTVLWTWVQWKIYSGDTLGTKLNEWRLGWALLIINPIFFFIFYSALESAAVIIYFKQLDKV